MQEFLTPRTVEIVKPKEPQVAKFPKCSEIGLQVLGQRGSEFVNAHDLENLLASGVEVSGYRYDSDREGWSFDESPCSGDTHRGLLIGIKPIQKDTAESLLKELIERGSGEWMKNTHDIIERAKKLQGG